MSQNKVTPESIEAVIAGEYYTRVPGTTLTICVLTLENGFHVIGDSACVDPDNFDVELGQRYAREKAVEKIWELEGYRLCQRQYEQRIKGK